MGRLGFAVGISLSIFLSACNKSDDIAVSQKVICEDGVYKSGIFGGKVVSADSALAKGTVFVLFRTGEKDEDGNELMEACTGSLIDRNIVLTAAHCVPQNQDAKKIDISFSTDPRCDAYDDGFDSAFVPAEAIVKHPDYKGPEDVYYKGTEYKNFSSVDMAMIRFRGQAPANKTVLKMQTEPVDLDQDSNVIVVGYGKTMDYNEKDATGSILRTTNITPLLSSDAPEKITKNNSAKVLYFDQSQGQGACAGDSGGPTLLKNESGLVILGVNSAVDSLAKAEFETQADVTCKVGLRSTSVLAQKNWILQAYTKLKNYNSTGLLP